MALLGKDRHTWAISDEPISHEEDLISFRPHLDQDQFTTWVTERLVLWFHRLLWHKVKRPSDVESGIVTYDEKCLLRYASVTTTLLASLLPVTATTVLYYVQDMRAKLGLIAGFTLVFALCLTTFTSAKKGQIFTAIAA